jgi:hypothetical protein
MAVLPIRRLPEWQTGPTMHSSIQTVRVTTGSVTGSAQTEITVTWPQPFPGTGYTVKAVVEEGTAATDTLQIKKIVSTTTANVTLRVVNADASARTGTLHVVGIAD